MIRKGAGQAARLAGFVAIAGLAACGGGNGSSDIIEADVSAVDGGTFSDASGTVTVVVPQGALGGDAMLRVASTRIAARKATTGSMRPISATASSVDTAPIATTAAAAGTASTASEHPAGRAIAKISTPASSTSEISRSVTVQAQGSACCHSVGRLSATPSRSASRDRIRIDMSRSSAA